MAFIRRALARLGIGMTITKMTDEECLKQVIDLLENRVSITTGFVPSEEDGYLTHQVLHISCGDFVVVSHPQPLEIPLQPVPLAELGVSIN